MLNIQLGNQDFQNPSTSSALQLQRLTHMVRSPSIKRTSPPVPPRSTRHKPEESSRATATTTSYSGVTQLNTTSFSTPTTSFTSSSATHEISITIERRFVAIERQQQNQQQQQDAMNVKLDLLDEVAHESNTLLKQMMADLKLSPDARGAKRDKPSDPAEEDQDEIEKFNVRAVPTTILINGNKTSSSFCKWFNKSVALILNKVLISNNSGCLSP